MAASLRLKQASKCCAEYFKSLEFARNFCFGLFFLGCMIVVIIGITPIVTLYSGEHVICCINIMNEECRQQLMSYLECL